MGFFGLGKSKSSTTAPPRISIATEMRIKSTLGIRSLESMPVQAARAFQLASNSNAKSDDFVKVIESDEVLSARIIRIANSVYFRRGQEAKDIAKAVANIGLNELRCLISATMLKSLLQGKQSAREPIWANAVATALACRSLSRYTNINEGEAFLCGLLHDVGKLIMIRRGEKLYEQVLSLIATGKYDFIEAEQQVFDLTHLEVGTWISNQWNFPENVIRAISYHHSPWPTDIKAQGKATSFAMLVKAADTFAHAAGIGHQSRMRPFRERMAEELAAATQQLGITTQDGNSFISSLERKFSEEYSLFQVENL